MWLTPSSTARRSTVIARSRSLGVPSGLAVRRIAPKPIRLTVRSPSVQVPALAAVTPSRYVAMDASLQDLDTASVTVVPTHHCPVHVKLLARHSG